MTWTLFVAALAALAPQAQAKSLDVALTRPGFELISDAARTELTSRLQDAKLPDQTITIPLLARVEAEDITFSVALDRLDAYPAEGLIGVDAVVDNVTVHIGRLRFEAWAVPFLGTTCTGTTVDAGRHAALPLSVQIGAKVSDGGIALKLKHLSFSMNRDQYAANGPGDCRGPFDIKDYFTRFVAGQVLAHARPLIEKAVHIEARRLVPRVAAMLNELAETPLVLGLPDLIVAPAARVALKGKPTALSLTPDGMRLALDLSVAPAGTPQRARRVRNLRHHPGTLYGTVGVHPELITELLAATLANGSRPVELKPAMDPMIETLTDRAALAAFWPDLDKVADAGNTLKLFARIVEPPVFKARPDGQGWHAVIPDLELHYQLNQGGAWIDYADLHVSAVIDAAPSVAGGKLALNVLSGTATATSTWAPTYHPVDPTFDSETTNAVFAAVIDLVATSETPPAFDLPVLPLAGYRLTAQALRIDGDLTTLDLVEAP